MVISYIIKLRLLDSFLEETIFSLCLSSVLNKSRLLRMSVKCNEAKTVDSMSRLIGMQ